MRDVKSVISKRYPKIYKPLVDYRFYSRRYFSPRRPTTYDKKKSRELTYNVVKVIFHTSAQCGWNRARIHYD